MNKRQPGGSFYGGTHRAFLQLAVADLALGSPSSTAGLESWLTTAMMQLLVQSPDSLR